MTLKVMQLNLWSGRIQRPIIELVKRELPDLLFAQEVLSFPGEVHFTSPWSTWRTLELMTAAGHFSPAFFAPSSTYPMFGLTLSYGNAVLSRFPLVNTSVHYTGGSGPRHFDQATQADHNATRNFQHAVIKVGGQHLNLINHHGHWVNQPLGDEVSVERLQIVADYINKLEGPVIMAGDLNLSPESPAIQKFLAATGLTDTTSRPGGTTLSAAHYVDRPIICDYIFISPELTLKEAKVHDAIVSDHRALTAEIEL